MGSVKESTDGEINFYGDHKIVENLAASFDGGWHGNGFWGHSSANQEVVKIVVEEEVNALTADNSRLAQVDCKYIPEVQSLVEAEEERIAQQQNDNEEVFDTQL